MKKGNIIDIGLNTIRMSGKVNMYVEKNSVQYLAHYFGFGELVLWLEEAGHVSYFNYLSSISQKDIPYIELQELLPRLDEDDLNSSRFIDILTSEDEHQAREIVREYYQSEIDEYRSSHEFSQLLQISCDFVEFQKQEKDIYNFINQTEDLHAFCYFLSIPSSSRDTIFWFQDGFYFKKSGFVKVTPKDWNAYKPLYEKLNQADKSKYNTIDKTFRLSTLFL